MTALLEVRDLRVVLRRRSGDVELVRGASLAVDERSRAGIVGESGSGKSLTALAVMGLLRPPLEARGSIRLAGAELVGMPERERRRVRGGRVAMIYQNPMSALNPVQRVGRQVVEAMLLHGEPSRRAARARAIELLGEVGVPAPARRIDSYPHEFSGGMRQRVMIAMAMSTNPSLLIGDEPTTALDVTTQARILELLVRLCEERGTAVVLITHDLAVAAGFCDRINVMYGGRVVETAARQALFAEPLHPYSEALLNATCDLDQSVDDALAAIPGQPPSPAAMPAGCSFHPRCPHALDLCRAQPPDDLRRGDRLVECHLANVRSSTGVPERSDTRA